MEKTLSEAEEQYIAWWEKQRLKEKRTLNQLLIGLPLGIVFASPILLNLFAGWHKRTGMFAPQVNPVVLIIAVMAIAAFVAIVSRRLKWDRKEQQYLEFLARRDQLQSGQAKKDPENPETPAAKRDD
ncbi:MAG TPA: hypothetical protein VD993_10335 [Chitinophagaceae bacterium]|nr:hypothetical protein [Chitinophagaceae bacterium]